MKLHILSDLHIEFADFEPPSTDADVVVLAGDIGVGLGGLDWACERFVDTPVIYVPGNHEFYRHDLSLVDRLKANSPGHVHLLNDDQVVIDGVRFLGSVLWTDFGLFGEADKFSAMRQAEQFMADFVLIQNSDQPFTPRDSVALHAAGALDTRTHPRCVRLRNSCHSGGLQSQGLPGREHGRGISGWPYCGGLRG